MPFFFRTETSLLDRLQPKRIARLLAVFLVATAVTSAWGDVQPPPRREASRLSAEQTNALNELLYRQRRLQVQLVRVMSDLRQGDTAAGLGQFQQLLDASGDSFLWTREGELTSVLQCLNRLMDEQPPVVWRSYEKMFGQQAAGLLRRGQSKRNSAVIADVARRFFHTRAGFEAVSWQASWLFDHGEVAAAAACYRRLLDSRVHRDRWNDALRLRAALVLQWAHESERSAQLLAGISAERVVVGGRNVVPEQWLQEQGTAQLIEPRITDWLLPLGTARHFGVAAASTPFSRPHWKYPLMSPSDPDSAAFAENLQEWEREQESKSSPLAAGHFAISLGSRVFVRDLRGVSALDSATGEVAWRYLSPASVWDLVEGEALAESKRLTRDRASLLGEAYHGNSRQGLLTCDGNRVYAVEVDPALLSESPDDEETGLFDGVVDVRNQLIALPAFGESTPDGAAQAPLWRIGGTAKTAGPLAGHCFLGPPLPVAGQLLVMSEFESTIYLSALEPKTGSLLWTQGIALATTPIGADANRRYRACVPSYARGMIVCSTETGLLVGFDPNGGELKWAYHYNEAHSPTQLRWGSRPHVVRGHEGFVNLPMIAGEQVVYLPSTSNYIHCVDLQTGVANWTTIRDDAEYLAAVIEERVIVVGERFCRALSLRDGAELWSTPISMPSGQGICLHDSYLIPLQEGRVIQIDVSTGKLMGLLLQQTSDLAEVLNADSPDDRQTSAAHRPGNLLAVGEQIVSVGARDVVAYPQSETLLASAEQRLRRQPDSFNDRLLAAELQITLGRLKSARVELQSLLHSSVPSKSLQHRIESLLREVLYLEVQQPSGDAIAVLLQLDELAQTPEQRKRFLLRISDYYLNQRQFAPVMRNIDELGRMEISGLLPVPDGSYLRVSAESWINRILSQVREKAPADQLADIEQRVDQWQQRVLREAGDDGLRRFLQFYSDWPQADRVRIELARRLIEQGEIQQGELLLLANRDSDAAEIQAESSRLLIELWDSLGLTREAGQRLARLYREHPDVLLDDGRRVHDFVRSYPRRGHTWLSFEQTEPPEWPIAHVALRGQKWSVNETETTEAYGTYRRRFISPIDSEFEILDKGSDLFAPQFRERPGLPIGGQTVRLAVISRQAGRIVREIGIPADASFPTVRRASRVGHFFPVGSSGVISGVSLIQQQEDNLWWSREIAPTSSISDVLKVGPFDAEFSTFQSRTCLCAVRPSDGRVMWQRTNIDPKAGLVSDPSTGLIGDKRVLVLFDDDRAHYTTLRTDTGEELRRGELDARSVEARMAFGRMLFHTTSTSHNRRMRLWDPLTDRFLLDEPLPDQLLTAVTDDGELVVWLSDNRLRILDGTTGEVRLETTLDVNDAALLRTNQLVVFSDRENYYINFQPEIRFLQSSRSVYFANNSFLPAEDFTGEVVAIRKTDGRVLWRREFPQRSFLQFPGVSLPLLVGISRVRDRSQGKMQSLLVEVIDRSTGETLAHRDNFLHDRLVQWNYDRRQGVLYLTGLQTQIVLDFSREKQILADPALEGQPSL